VYEDFRFIHIITELCSGGELFDKICTNEKMTENVVAKYFKQLLQAVDYCHDKSIIHKDLKPENLLLEEPSDDSRLIVIDFGISEIMQDDRAMSKAGSYLY